MPLRFLWIEILFIKKRRMKKIGNADLKALTYFVDNTQLYRIIGALDDVVNGGFGYTTFGKKLILGHAVLVKQLFYTQTNGFIQFHQIHHTRFLFVL